MNEAPMIDLDAARANLARFQREAGTPLLGAAPQILSDPTGKLEEASRTLGVDTRPAPEPPVEAPPGRGCRVGVTRDGLVAMNYGEPVTFLALTPDQAHSFGRAMIKHASKARKVKK